MSSKETNEVKVSFVLLSVLPKTTVSENPFPLLEISVLSRRFLLSLPASPFKASLSQCEHNNERGHGAPVVHERCENLLQMRQEQ